ncbi:MAG TPA: DNA translocase FtsK 4TM domain-containing protein, partial [Candidatus Elarobacter sp.]|nr:DNA translocase FtsK 4TM domain-containing protein [Candidatus Elarobacter sp.]
MARVRRKSGARMRWNLEIAGMAALAFALLLGIALVAPAGRTGAIGAGVAFALHGLFGAAAALFAILIALVGAIVFLEINVPRMIATLGGAACAYFVAIDAAIAAAGRDGGVMGHAIAAALRALLGDAGTWIVIALAVIAVTVAITGVSVKKVIGWCVTRLAALRPPKPPAGAVAALRPASLREAFHLPALLPRAAQPAAAAAGIAAPEIPAPTHTVVEPQPVRFYDE